MWVIKCELNKKEGEMHHTNSFHPLREVPSRVESRSMSCCGTVSQKWLVYVCNFWRTNSFDKLNWIFKSVLMNYSLPLSPLCLLLYYCRRISLYFKQAVIVPRYSLTLKNSQREQICVWYILSRERATARARATAREEFTGCSCTSLDRCQGFVMASCLIHTSGR